MGSSLPVTERSRDRKAELSLGGPGLQLLPLAQGLPQKPWHLYLVEFFVVYPPNTKYVEILNRSICEFNHLWK